MNGKIIALAGSGAHDFSKQCSENLLVIAGIGIEGDAHAGEKVQHLSRVAIDPAQPNLRQVHLLHSELLDELRSEGFEVEPGQLGENMTTRGIDLLGLPAGTVLRIGQSAQLKGHRIAQPLEANRSVSARIARTSGAQAR
ncbi:MOSC domain-containing protein [Aurantiacibacter gilvus]|uniref:MOSC domain-containing protein n=1 Tax=Aurantiacibacter gilvus TaxID=3139141 RepID=A0ABU9IHB6_9SPHN